MAQDILQLTRLVSGVDRDHDHPDPGRREEHSDPVGAVRQPKRDVVALFQAGGKQTVGNTINFLVEAGEGNSLALGHQEFSFGHFGCCTAQKIAQCKVCNILHGAVPSPSGCSVSVEVHSLRKY